jgi:hypothetical protein
MGCGHSRVKSFKWLAWGSIDLFVIIRHSHLISVNPVEDHVEFTYKSGVSDSMSFDNFHVPSGFNVERVTNVLQRGNTRIKWDHSIGLVNRIVVRGKEHNVLVFFYGRGNKLLCEKIFANDLDGLIKLIMAHIGVLSEDVCLYPNAKAISEFGWTLKNLAMK